MKNYNYTIDYKITSWKRCALNVEANNEEEAFAKVKFYALTDELKPLESRADIAFIDWEHLEDCDCYIHNKANEPTVTIFRNTETGDDEVFNNLDK